MTYRTHYEKDVLYGRILLTIVVFVILSCIALAFWTFKSVNEARQLKCQENQMDYIPLPDAGNYISCIDRLGNTRYIHVN